MITCPKCSKENQDHYKFCLGCGAELPREHAPKPFSPQTPPHGVPAVNPRCGSAGVRCASRPAPAPAAAPAMAAAPRRAPAPLAPQVAQAPAAARRSRLPLLQQRRAARWIVRSADTATPPHNRFCASCGYNLAALVASQPPAAQAARRRRSGRTRRTSDGAARGWERSGQLQISRAPKQSRSAATRARSSPATAIFPRATQPSRAADPSS